MDLGNTSSRDAQLPLEGGAAGVASLPDQLRGLSPAAIVCAAIFIVLAGIDIIRTFRHAMWRDELQIFMLAQHSTSPVDLFWKLKYEAHPELWHLLVWIITRFTDNPVSMQLLQVVLAICTWLIVYRSAPFERSEKLLLLASYFLFWEYFVMSRSYVLCALFGFAFVVVRLKRPSAIFVPWLLLGLLANVFLYGTIWSMALAVVFVIEARRCDRAFLAGGMFYLACVVLAVATITPASDYGPLGSEPRLDLSRLNRVLEVPLGAFMPIEPQWVADAITFIPHPGWIPAPQFWNPNPIDTVMAFARTDTDHPLRMALVFAAPLLVCWLLTRDRLRFFEFALPYLGILLFADIWDYPGRSRHQGIIFLMLIACAWRVRAQNPAMRRAPALLKILLAVSAFGGIMTLVSELKPFSHSRDAATWIERNNLADAFLIGSRDAQVSSVSGYLNRPFYYLECECVGTYIVWNGKRVSSLTSAQFGRRLAQAVDQANGREIVLVRSEPIILGDLAGNPGDLASAPGIKVTLLQFFVGAEVNEDYWIYRVGKRPP